MLVESESITLRTEEGNWLGQIIVTSDGAYTSITDWGNLSYSWRNCGEKTLAGFKDFLCQLEVEYFAEKLFCGINYICCDKKVERACRRYAAKILPALKKHIKSAIPGAAGNCPAEYGTPNTQSTQSVELK